MILDYLLARARLFFKSEEGASAIEYAIVVAMVAVVVVVFVTPMGTKVFNIFSAILTSLGGTAPTKPGIP
ncbi:MULTISPECIES: Flp family type IVb pilin [Pseudomonas]|jgi:pilus assembly protein Flp/PilA|uniref:Flp family type IVb pilin n=1 Tax=Pseudomonas kribbensis TaxID=1628086 RepID=A0A345RJX3_9PSED|nr:MULTISPECIES: Flp family type IVb pilin [Pseudomonas]AXI59589.1 Flp family type IVb pilin [Pseudomonas kribbensis]MCX2542740.1 Flp family type IVb pilin [Pseudomonas sp. COW5]MDI2142820.1 Flp family type IVb pilin [Pseudomonas sp. ITA]MDL5592470.1 Flp family type IVb pilin [Bacillus subtilis]